MAKIKNKKKESVSDKARSKKKDISTNNNPFEVKFNKQKHKVLGKKIAKFDKGRPGVSRSRAIQKRKETLLVEYKETGKVNKMMDKRMGENNPDMSVEDKMLQRFAAERKKTHGKAQTFSLNEEDTLTHYGQSLSEIEKFDDPVVSDDDEDEGTGKIAAKMVAEEHFGGGILKKVDETDPGKHRSWKERMEEIIAKSKKEKYERQHEKEKTREQTEQLDQEWKELRFAMTLKKDKKDDETDKKKNTDEYDIAVRELHFEMKGKATDRMKTEEELATEEKERLEKLEEDRLRRMRGITDEEEAEKNKRKRASADDLDDGFSLTVQDKYEVKYKDGNLIGRDEEGDEDADEEDDAEDDESDEEMEENNSDEDEEEMAKDGSEEEESEESDESGDDAMAHLSDLESDDDDEEEEEEEEDEPIKSQVKERIKGQGNRSDGHESKHQQVQDIKVLLKKKKEVMEEARKELPYTYKAPETYKQLQDLLKDHNTIDKVIIIERIRTCHHPSLAEGNKTKLELLFKLLLEYYGDLALQQPPDFRLIDKLIIHMYELAQQGPVTAGKAVLDLVLQRQAEYQARCEIKNGKGQFPSIDMLLYFKLISILFPTSDLQHPVVTPALLFMSQIITQSLVQTTRDVASGLLLCNIFLEYVSFSKRFVPEVINFLAGILFLATEKDSSKIEPVIPPFKPIGKFIDLLKLKCDHSDQEEITGPVNLHHIFTPQIAMSYLMSDQYRLCCIKLTVSLLKRFSTLYKTLPSFKEIFQPVCYFCNKLPSQQYPQDIKENIQNLTNDIEEKSRKKDRKHLTLVKTKTKALRLYEPKIDEDFDPTRKSFADRGKVKNEKQKLVHKHKRELKSAIREIRKDTQFLAHEKLNEQISRDDERKRKVRALIGSLAAQEGDFKAIKKKKIKPMT